jgi:hypothetical protein
MFEMAHVLVIRVAKETMSLDTKLPFKKWCCLSGIVSESPTARFQRFVKLYRVTSRNHIKS